MKAQDVVEMYLHTPLNSVLDAGELWASQPS
jgi:hypothetical protein